MRITTKIAISTIILITVTTSIVTALVLLNINRQTKENIQTFKQEEYQRVEEKLKSLVDVTFESINNTYTNSNKKEYIQKVYGERLKSIIDSLYSQIDALYQKAEKGEISSRKAQEEAKELVKAVRYDGGTGYVWINDTGKPYPKMIMHPIAQQLDGKVLDSANYNVADGNKNLFTAMVEEVQGDGDGYVRYLWPKPGKENPQPKLSYVRLFREWGWIIGTGIYIDDAAEEAVASILSEVEKYRYDNGTGYFWINDTQLPSPNMIMHPISPQLNGTKLDSEKYHVAEGGQNLFKLMAEKVLKDGEGYVKYLWPKPGKDTPQPKLSYVRLFEPLGWVIGTGVYTDDIDENVILRTQQVSSQNAELTSEIIIASVIMLIIAAFISVLNAKGVTASIHKTISIIKDLSKGSGDLTKRLDAGNTGETKELSENLNKMLDNLDDSFTELIKGLAMSAESLVPIIGSTSSVNNSLTTTSDMAQQVATAAEEMSSSIAEIANSTSDAAAQNSETVEIAQQGRDIINTSEEISSEMRTKIDILTGEIDELTGHAAEIENVITVINDISEQTNLLALNAAIEAARAGEAGRGFAVVADEVRKLAEKTKDSTEDIRKMVVEMQNKVKSANEGGTVVTELVAKQSDIDVKTSESFRTILDAVENMQSNILSISSAVDEQSAVTTQIASSVETVSMSSVESKEQLAKQTSHVHTLINSIMETSNLFSQYKLKSTGSKFAIAKLQHMIYMNKLFGVYTGSRSQMDDLLVDHHSCAFGKFYDTVGAQEHGDLTEFKAIEPVHKRVHANAADVCRAVKNGDMEQAESSMLKTFEAAEELMGLLNKIINR